MDLVLECTAGPLKGRQFPLKDGQVITFGRTSKSSVPIPDDKFLSGIHFGVERRADSCLLSDKKSSNGTFLNGNRVSDAVVKPGDEIRAGDSFFAVRFGKASGGASVPPPAPPPAVSEVMQTLRSSGSSASASRPSESAPPAYAPPPPPPAPPPAIPAPPPRPPAPSTSDSGAREHAAVVGHWVLNSVPAGWEVVEEYGIQEAGREGVPASAMVSEEPLPSGMTLDEFVQSQIGSLRQYLRDPRIERSGTPAISGADDALALDVRYKTRDGQGIYYRSIYARRGDRVGLLTLTSLETDWTRVRAVFEQILSGVSFR
jgi:hypothetical protein